MGNLGLIAQALEECLVRSVDSPHSVGLAPASGDWLGHLDADGHVGGEGPLFGPVRLCRFQQCTPRRGPKIMTAESEYSKFYVEMKNGSH